MECPVAISPHTLSEAGRGARIPHPELGIGKLDQMPTSNEETYAATQLYFPIFSLNISIAVGKDYERPTYERALL